MQLPNCGGGSFHVALHWNTNICKCNFKKNQTQLILSREFSSKKKKKKKLMNLNKLWDFSTLCTHINSITTRVLTPASWDYTSDQSLFSSGPHHCHLPITNSQNHESTNQNRPGAVQLLCSSCYKIISCKYQRNGGP